MINIYKKFIFHNLSLNWAKDKYERIKSYLKQNENILDIGSGKCGLSYLLKINNFSVTSMDIKNLSYTRAISPIIYNGINFPFKDNSFDVSLLLTVLHHTKNPINIIKEAKRVSKKIIIIEDVYDNNFQKHLTFFTDSLFNLEFIDHPHNNKNEIEWENIFQDLNLEIISRRKDKVLFFFKQSTYVLEKSIKNNF